MLFSSLIRIRKGERSKTIGMFFYFFIIIAAYWLLKPLRSTLTVEKLGADSIRQLKVITAFVSAAVVVSYSLALTRFSRERLAYLVLGTFVWLMLFFWFFFTWYGTAGMVYYCFYVFLDLFVTVNVALFWAFLADIFDSDSAKRLYSLIGAGGIIGGLMGSYANNFMVDRVQPADMILLVAGAYALVFPIVFLVGRRVRRQKEVAEGVISEEQTTRLAAALAGARDVVSSRYFLGICFLLGAYELISTVNDFTFHKAVELAFKNGGTMSVLGLVLTWIDRVTGLSVTAWLQGTFGLQIAQGTMASFFSEFFLALNVITMVVQVVVTSIVIRRAGMTAALMFLPIVLVGFSTAFLAFPIFMLIELLYLLDNSLNYSINQTSREMLFVPVPRQEKYRALAFIDMFVQRFAKAVAGFLLLFLTAIASLTTSESLRWYMCITVPLATVWMVVAAYLGRAFRGLADKAPGLTSTQLSTASLRTGATE